MPSRKGISPVEAAVEAAVFAAWMLLWAKAFSSLPHGPKRGARRPRNGAALDAPSAAQPGGGRAAGPWKIPARGWADIFLRVYRQIAEDRLLAVAAGVVFYSLLAVVPAITAFVSSYGLFADITTIASHLAFAQDMMPRAAYEIIRDQIARIVAQDRGGLTLGFAVGLAVALWSANAAMKALFDGLNVVYGAPERRGFIRLNLVSLAVTAGAIGVLMLMLGAVVAYPIAISFFGVGSPDETLIALARWPALFFLAVIALSVLYRVGPSRRAAPWRRLVVGSLFGAAAWLATSLALSWYLSRFADYNATYGSLGAIIGLMMWMWLSTIAVLMGGELNAEVEYEMARAGDGGRAT